MTRIFFFAFLLIFFCGCSNFEKITQVEYIKVQDLQTKKVFQGIVKANNSASLSFQSEGKIIYLPYTKGDFVKKGTVIARLDGVLYSIKKNEEEARLKEYFVQRDKQKRYYDRLDILHKEGAISDNDWESAFYELQITLQQIKIQKEKINYINKELSYNTIIAPYDGYISQKILDVESYAKIAQPVVEFISSFGAQVEVMVGENVINQIALGEEAKIIIQNNIYYGKVAHISKSSLNTGGYLVKIALNNSLTLIKEGMSAQVELTSLKSENIFLPINSIYEEDGKYYINKIVNIKNNIGSLEKTQVLVGKIYENNVEILKGVKKGDVVALSFDGENRKVRL